jgi:hypothetical protein
VPPIPSIPGFSEDGPAACALGQIARHPKRTQCCGIFAVRVSVGLWEASVSVASALAFICLRIALRMKPENGPTKPQ